MTNLSPTAFNDSYSVDEDAVLKVSPGQGVLSNDTDADNDKLAAALATAPENPLFKINTNGSFTYDARYHGYLYVDPDTGTLVDPADDDNEVLLPEGFNSLAAGAEITDTYTYKAYDGQAWSLGTVTVTITGVNDDPVATDDSATVASGGTVGFAVVDDDTDADIYPVADTLTATSLSDVDDGNGGTASADGTTITTDAGGTATILADGTVEYTAAADFFGVDTFIYKVEDGHGGSDTGTIRITVTPTNQNPTATDDSYSVGEDAGNTVFNSPTVLANDSDPDTGDLIAAQLVAGTLRRVDSTGATISGNTGLLTDFNTDGTFSYNPNGEFESLGDGDKAYVAFDYDAFDAEGTPYRATVTITVNGANDPVYGSIADKSAMVYEAGLSNGSGDGPTTITRTFDYTSALISLQSGDPEGDTIYLVRVDSNGEGVTATAAGDTITGLYGTFTLVDLYDNGTGATGPDGLVDGVSYTLSSATTHGSVQGHNALAAADYDKLKLGFTDGMLNGDGDAYVLDFTAQTGGTNNVTGIAIDVVDDVNFLGVLPVDANGSPVGTLDTVDDKSVNFATGATATDTFTHVMGADGAYLDILSGPGTFTLNDGRTVSSASFTDSNGNEGVRGTDSDGAKFYEITFDPQSATNVGSYTLTMFQSPPVVVNNIDFSAITAGGPQENPFVDNIGFNGYFFSAYDTGANLLASLVDYPAANAGEDDINPNNAGGIGIGNGNIEIWEILGIDVRGSSGGITGIELDLQGVGGGIASSLDLLYVAVDDGAVVDFGSVTTTDINVKGGETLRIEPLLDPGEEIDFLYVALNPDDIDSNDKARINRIATLEQQATEDILLRFQMRSDEGTQDGDQSPVSPSYEDFIVTIEGDNGGTIDPGLVVL